jgi:site-specific DNA-methyltransferase (adenine-specific)
VTPYYADDLVTIYHGDCREWMPEARVVVADPPYGVAWSGTSSHDRIDPRTGRRKAGKRRDVGGTVTGDDLPFDPAPILALGLPTVLFGANHYADRLPSSSSWFVWDKRDGGLFGPDQSDCEMAWTNLGGPARIYREMWNVLSRVRDERSAGGGSPVANHHRPLAIHHPTQKPVGLMRWVIQRCPDGTILDPFMGSGSTLVAAKSLGRYAIGIEIEERYCEIAANRCRQEVLGLVG